MKDADTKAKLKQIDPEVQRSILDAVVSLSFGTVEITIHDGRVVQIDRRERIRIERNGKQRD